MNQRPRQPSGTPSGGQRTRQRHDPTEIALDVPPPADPAWVIDWEEHPWESFAGQRPRGPYRAAVVPAIAELDLHIDNETMIAAADAAREIARFDAEIDSRFAPFASLLLRSESAASSEIENLSASAKAVLMAEAGDTSRQNASIVASNAAAMRAALALADAPDAEAIIEMHRSLLERSNPTIVGHWRTEQVWIGGRQPSPHDAMFVPPHQSRVPEAIDDLVRFMRRDDLEPFTQTMIAHAQFETIHPFPDGNGRTGRALIHALLRNKGVAHSATVPISAGLLQSTDRYFDALTAYRRGDLSPIVSLSADAAHVAIGNGRRLANDVNAVTARWRDLTVGIRSDSVVHRVVADLPALPVLDATAIQDRYAVSAPTASNAINQLVELGILSRANGGLRSRKFIAHDISNILDDFARRAGRRSAAR